MRVFWAVAAWLALSFFVVSCSEPTGPATPARESIQSVVTRLVDGDTFWISGSKIRLIGVDTPETKRPGTAVECFGKQSAARLAQLLPVGTRVRLVYDAAQFDRFGRTLAYVYREDDALFVNAALVREGFARVMTVEPNVAHQRDFEELERRARIAGLGRWTTCPPR